MRSSRSIRLNGMRRIVTAFFLLWSGMMGLFTLTAQELRATVQVNSAAVQRSSRELFRSLEESLHHLLNGEQWGDSFTIQADKINCSFTLLVTELVSDESFRGELYLQSTRRGDAERPEVTLLLLRDREVEFSYSPFQPLIFDMHHLRDNLTAMAAYYACLIIALDRDAAEPLGGTPYFRKMEQIASAVQSNRWRGWEINRRPGGRTAIATAFNDASLERYRMMWYRFHADPQLTTAAEAVELLYSLHREDVGHPLLNLFGDARLHELVSILRQGTPTERAHWLQQLREIYPTRNDALEKLRE